MKYFLSTSIMVGLAALVFTGCGGITPQPTGDEERAAEGVVVEDPQPMEEMADHEAYEEHEAHAGHDELPEHTEPIQEEESAAHDHDHDHDHGHGHHHEAPRGGTLIVLGDHLGHFELLLDPVDGKMTLYALDGHAEEPVRLAAESITLEVLPKNSDAVYVLELGAVASPLTGETVGDTSEFTVANPRLRGLEEFSGRIPSLSFRGVDVGPVAFEFPEGNE